MPPVEPLAAHQHDREKPEDTLEFLKRTRSELRSLRTVRLFADRVQVLDVNGDYFEIVGLGYADPGVLPVLRFCNAVFNPDVVHDPPSGQFKEYSAGKRYPWAHDRVM